VSAVRGRGVAIGLGCLVFVAAVVTFWPGLTGDFLNWDDEKIEMNNVGELANTNPL